MTPPNQTYNRAVLTIHYIVILLWILYSEGYPSLIPVGNLLFVTNGLCEVILKPLIIPANHVRLD